MIAFVVFCLLAWEQLFDVLAVFLHGGCSSSCLLGILWNFVNNNVNKIPGYDFTLEVFSKHWSVLLSVSSFCQLDKSQLSSGTCEAGSLLPKEPFHYQKGQMAARGAY